MHVTRRQQMTHQERKENNSTNHLEYDNYAATKYAIEIDLFAMWSHKWGSVSTESGRNA
jgi:hypothetical protein